jgi:hypothetical protein
MPISIPTQAHLRICTHTLDDSSIRHCTTDYANFNTTPTPTAQPMIGTQRFRTRIYNAPAGWSSSFDTVHGKYCRFKYMFHHDTNHDTTGLCVTFGGAVDWKSRQLKPTAQSTTEHRNRHMIDASNVMSGRMVIWKELRTWHS